MCKGTKSALKNNRGREDGLMDWWLRSPGINTYKVHYIGRDGVWDTIGIPTQKHGIRPTILVSNL